LTQPWRDGKRGNFWAGVPDATRLEVVDAYLETWLDRVEGFDLGAWSRVDRGGGSGTCGWAEYRLCWVDYKPGTLRGPNPTAENFATWSYYAIPQMRADGVNGALLDRYAGFMHRVYPNGGFDALVR
jgi:hypothetical protein